MKQLEIKTNKRLLIVEFEDMDHLQNVLSCDKKGIRFCTDNDEPTKLICKGSDITEEVAEEFSKPVKSSHGEDGFINYLYESKEIVYSPAFVTALESFISAIQSKNHHWGENPYEKELDSCNAYTDMFTIAKRTRKYEEAQARTFNPSKCIIFEIV